MKEAGRDQRPWILLLIAGFAAGLTLRIYLASFARSPGHGDSAFYFSVAKNIVDGRGLVVDYVVYFFAGLVPIPHYAGDFWNPLAEILLSLPMWLWGKSIFNALLASIAAGFIPAIVCFFVARKFSNSIAFAVMASVLTFASPYEVLVSTLTEAIIFYGAFGSLSLLLAIKGRSNPAMFALAAMCTGLAQLVRQDGVLLLFTLLVCIGVAPLRLRTRVLVAGVAVAIHVMILAPLLIRNYREFHSLVQPGPASTMFMTSYEDFHSFGKELDWTTLRASWGIRTLIRRRLHTAGENLAQVKFFLNPVLLYLASLGAANMLMMRQRSTTLHMLLPAAVFAAFEFVFYTVFASFSGPGSLPKGLAVALPFVCLLIVDFFDSFLGHGAAFALALLALSAYAAQEGYQANYWSAIYYNGIYQNYGTVRSIVLTDAQGRGLAGGDIVIMARDVWDVYEGTGFKTVMIPNNDLETILFVAHHYNARYILLPAPRKALEDIYRGTTPDPRFAFLAGVPDTDWKIFRLQVSAP